MKTLPPVRYIDTPAALMELCVQLRGNPWLALDTEFLREKTYYPKLCLLQIATPELVACIDPLALEDLSPLLDVIYEDGITKVLHAARQDMEIFFHLRNTLPSPVFDTQIAALLLGFPDQIGYGNLVKGTLGIELEKLHTRTDWSRRPLSDEQTSLCGRGCVLSCAGLPVSGREALRTGPSRLVVGGFRTVDASRAVQQRSRTGLAQGARQQPPEGRQSVRAAGACRMA